MNEQRHVVAVVDDDLRLLESIEELLESAGYAVRGYVSAEALLRSGLAELDLMITDIGMPGMDGFALRAKVKTARPELPVFMVTGRHELAYQDRAQEMGRFFRKPFDAQDLLSAIGEALQKPARGG